MKPCIILFFNLPGWANVILLLLLAVVVFFAIKALLGIVYIPEDKTGVVTKKFVLFGANRDLPEGRIIATKGEAGYQAEMLPPGLHFFYWFWQYNVAKIKFTVVPEGQMFLIEAVDGAPLDAGRVTAKFVESNKFQDATAFLNNGGQKGKQRDYLTPGTYRINTALFNIFPTRPVEIEQGQVGIITTMDGDALPKDEIAGKTVPGHSNYQNADGFINSGGNRGLQEQVSLAGVWFINPWFAEVKVVPMTTIPVGYVGVVVSFVGDAGADVSGDQFQHGNIVKRGQKGVWEETLDPGRYAVNTDIMTVTPVPTTNIVLNWATARTEAHKLDEKLSTIIVRSSDGFTFNMDVSQIINISNKAAAKVIARFGSVQNLVSQVLEPTIGNYFRNSAQQSDVIDFLKSRSDRQSDAKKRIEEVLKAYDVVAVDTLIGDIVPPPQLMQTLTDRKIAQQQQQTFKTQKEAQDQRQELEASTASADMQKQIVASNRNVVISENLANAKIKTAEGDAKSKTINAEADATVTKTIAAADAEATTVKGTATAKVTLSIGTAEADVLKMKTNSLGAAPYAQIQIADALSKHNIKLVPDIMISGSNGHGDGGSVLSALISNELLKEMREKGQTTPPSTPESGEKK